MKKLILLLLTINLLISKSIFNTITYKSIKKSILKKSSDLILKTTKKFDNSIYTKKLLQNKSIKVYKPIDKIAVTATLIANKGGVISDITKKNPLKIVNYYSKYGDDFIKVTNTLLPTVQNIKIPKNIIQKYNLKNINFLKNKENLIKRFLSVMKYTGQQGFDISKKLLKFAYNNKYALGAGIAFAWFLADPESFNEELNKFGGNVEEFITSIVKTTSNTAANTINHSVDSVVTSLKSLATTQNILFVLGLLLLIVIWKMRKILLNYINLKIVQKEKELEEEIKNIKTRSRYE